MSDQFWSSELGEITGNASDAFAKSFKQIPDGTMALSKIKSFYNADYNGNKFLLIKWILTAGDFQGSEVEQKLKVFGDPQSRDSAKARHRALNMLKLVYQLFNVKPKHAGVPTDEDLAVFVGKIAGIKIRETEPNEQGRQYNWVAEIHEAKGFICETGISIVVTPSVEQLIGTYSSQGPIDSAFDRQNKNTHAETHDDVPF